MSVRVTDAVDYFRRRGELGGAVGFVRRRDPERFRWRTAVGTLAEEAGRLRGMERARVEEPVREVVLDLSDLELRREIVLDARRVGVDLDRGEILPVRTVLDLRRIAFHVEVDLDELRRHVPLADDVLAPVETAAVAIIGRALASRHRTAARRLWRQVPARDDGLELTAAERFLAQAARSHAKRADGWSAFARAVLDER
ncbi:MAG: hypothetical protein NZ898_14470 [Myxococcota bacterium]|nr:hypothetical protein [Myxococcota bacterium]MDW8364035.1 hypothetical protein [Myxococcales bacterium]